MKKKHSNDITGRDSRAFTAAIILQPTRFSGTAEERIADDGTRYSRQAARDYRHSHPEPQKGKKFFDKGEVPTGQHLSGCGPARTHLENIGLGISLRCPILKAFKNRYRGGSWNKTTNR